MPVDEPSWWYADTQTIPEHVLAPAAWIYGRIARARLRRPHTYKSSRPVVCVGNLTAGGTGKTPLTRLITEWLASDGYAPCVLTRGFGGRMTGPHMIDAERDTAADVGDEPLLLARTCSICLARDRAAGAQAVEALGRENIIVMDDGLQNPTLFKDLSIAIVDAKRGLGNRRVIPSGPLRASAKDQLALVDCIVVNHGFTAEMTEQDRNEHNSVTWLRKNFDGPVLSAHVVPDGEHVWLRIGPVIAYAGIANPQRFFDLLIALGAELHEQVVFHDHQMLSNDDARRLLDLARHHRARLVTTEKDHVRLPDAEDAGPLAELKRSSRTVPIRLQFEPADEDWLRAELLRIAAAVRGRTP